MGRAARSEPYTDEKNAIKLKYTHFPVIKNTIKRKEFKIAYESSILFQSFYMPAFLQNLRLMRPLYKIKHTINNDRFFFGC